MPSLDSGSSFGPYSIEGFIAGGGMGEVYAARHAVYGTPVAIKVLHPALHRDEGWRLRFNEEGVVGQQLKHPNVLSARELIEHDGRVALVLDLVTGGQTLLRVMEREFPTGLPLVRALNIFLGIVQGTEYLHAKGVIHGDLKPENVLIEGNFRNADSWVVRVTDFGTVGLVAHPVKINGRTAVVATPRYASPEHLYGVDHLEVRSDIYALGLVLHFLLTGRHASPATSVEEAAEIVRGQMPLVNVVDQPEVAVALMVKATQPTRDERFPTCRDLALAVRDALDAVGSPLALEDLKSELATEIMEERAKKKSALASGGHTTASSAATEIALDPVPLPMDPPSDAGPPSEPPSDAGDPVSEPPSEPDVQAAGDPVSEPPSEPGDPPSTTDSVPPVRRPAVSKPPPREGDDEPTDPNAGTLFAPEDWNDGNSEEIPGPKSRPPAPPIAPVPQAVPVARAPAVASSPPMPRWTLPAVVAVVAVVGMVVLAVLWVVLT